MRRCLICKLLSCLYLRPMQCTVVLCIKGLNIIIVIFMWYDALVYQKKSSQSAAQLLVPLSALKNVISLHYDYADEQILRIHLVVTFPKINIRQKTHHQNMWFVTNEWMTATSRSFWCGLGFIWHFGRVAGGKCCKSAKSSFWFRSGPEIGGAVGKKKEWATYKSGAHMLPLAAHLL